MKNLIGRRQEQSLMKMLLTSNDAEFLAVYGRRRVGKTFLIKSVYEKEIVFQITGIANASTAQQLTNFLTSIKNADPGLPFDQVPANWMEAFGMLRSFIEERKEKKKVIFFDELPWIDTPQSDFMMALEHFWNSWASSEPGLVLTVCGSAASWMINKLINNKGGLHNRVTRRIKLMPFTLSETEAYLKSKNILLDRYQITQLYMVMGGIPFYLKEIMPGRSAFQEIDRLCFTEGGLLVSEYDNLYRSLFSNAEKHLTIIEALAKKPKGLTRDELIKVSGLSNGGNTTKAITELNESGFINQAFPFGKKMKASLYRLSDPYSLFYLKFIKNNKSAGEGSWISRIDHPSWRAWSGYAYENICFMHISQVKKALGISGVYTEVASWKSREKGIQIDLLIDRRDHIISLCEIKYSKDSFTITLAYKAELEKKLAGFRTETQTRKAILLTMLTTFGVEENKHSLGFVQNIVKMEDLFEN